MDDVRFLSPEEQVAFPDLMRTDKPKKKRKCVTAGRVINAEELLCNYKEIEEREEAKSSRKTKVASRKLHLYRTLFF